MATPWAVAVISAISVIFPCPPWRQHVIMICGWLVQSSRQSYIKEIHGNINRENPIASPAQVFPFPKHALRRIRDTMIHEMGYLCKGLFENG